MTSVRAANASQLPWFIARSAGLGRPAAVAWGVTAMYLLAAVEITSLVKAKLPRRVWRMTHMAAFSLFSFAAIHAITAGTDTGSRIFEGSALLAIALVCD